jgi:hypothetical protein
MSFDYEPGQVFLSKNGKNHLTYIGDDGAKDYRYFELRTGSEPVRKMHWGKPYFASLLKKGTYYPVTSMSKATMAQVKTAKGDIATVREIGKDSKTMPLPQDIQTHVLGMLGYNNQREVSRSRSCSSSKSSKSSKSKKGGKRRTKRSIKR